MKWARKRSEWAGRGRQEMGRTHQGATSRDSMAVELGEMPLRVVSAEVAAGTVLYHPRPLVAEGQLPCIPRD